MAMYIGDITAADIVRAQLKDKAFERFVRKLLDAEADLRHRATATTRGPVAPYRRDDKRDLIFEVRDPPRQPRDDFPCPLTWDELGQTWYSCKGGHGWARSFLAELGRATADAGGPPGKRIKNRPPARLLDHLSQGRRFVFVIAEETLDDDAFLAKAEGVLGYWLDNERRGRPETLRQQLEVIDAHALARFIARHKPSNLGEDLQRALGISVPAGFREWNGWTRELGGRELTEFESDASRDEILAAIADPSRPVLRIFGPPGAGKTRVAHEGIRRLGEDTHARVRYCNDLDASLKLDRWLRDAGAVWVVLDELRSIDAELIEPSFRAHADAGARLLLVGTSDEGTRSGSGRAFALGELDDEAIERVIRHEFARLGAMPSPEQLGLVRKLSERFPWYAVLLARALAHEPRSVERGDDEGSCWSFGARRVLAGHPQEHASVAAWDREAELRAKCLLVAMLTHELALPWDELWARHGASLALAIDEPRDWHEVKRRELPCRQRQLLRQSGLRRPRRYVSPNNLARLVLHRFFDGPEGPDLGPMLRRHAPELRGTLLAIAKAVHVKPAVVERLARGEWQELGRRIREDGSEAVTEYLGVREASQRAAVLVPEAAAWAAAETIGHLGELDLAAAPRVRDTLARVLMHVVRRALPTHAFLAAEAALLALSRSEHEPWAHDHGAGGIWKRLFLPTHHQTHQPWSLRLSRLDERLADPDLERRGAAIDALGLAVASEEDAFDHGDDERRDGPWPLPTPNELPAMKAALWRRLLDACSDPSERAAERARMATIGRLRREVGRTLLAPELRRLAAMSPSWAIEPRRLLSEKVADLRRYDADRLAEHSDILDAISELEAALAPTSLRERIVAQVGTFNPGPWRMDDDERPAHEQTSDRGLARELLETPDDHAWVLRWLATPRASRSHRFWQALGYVDRERMVLPELLSLVHEGTSVRALTDYLLGWSDDEGSGAAEGWIDRHLDSVALAPAFVGLWAALPPSATRLARLQAAIAEGSAAEGIGLVVHHRWVDALDLASMLAFARTLAARDDLVTVALGLAIQLLERATAAPTRDELLTLLAEVLDRSLDRRVVIGTQEWFQHGVIALASAARHAEVAALVVRALDVSDDPSNVGLGQTLAAKLLQGGFAEDLWPHWAAAMSERPHSLLVDPLADEHILAHLPAERVLAWLGRDQRRARIIAGLCNPHDAGLDVITRELLARFGPEGEVANTLTKRARKDPGVLSGGMTSFEHEQHAHAIHWAEDPEPAVREWAQRLAKSLAHDLDEREAHRAFRRERG